MTDEQLLRYSRHILLPQVGVEGQEQLLAARALVVGAGGLGSPAAYYLASAGVGTLVLADGDTVDLTNLQRQILHRTDAVGRPKAESGRDTLAGINPGCRVIPLIERLSGTRLDEEVAAADVVLDCSDNFATRHAVNRACLFPEGEDAEEVRCAVMGVFAPLTGIIGAVQAAEALKLMIGCGETLAGRLLLLDGLAMEWRSIAVPRDPACSVCSACHHD
jgi:molybdopterin/thiamine biosynthesis adenylyltransferase